MEAVSAIALRTGCASLSPEFRCIVRTMLGRQLVRVCYSVAFLFFIALVYLSPGRVESDTAVKAALSGGSGISAGPAAEESSHSSAGSGQ